MSAYDEVDAAVAAGLASPVPVLPAWAREDLRRYRTAYAEGRAMALAKLAASQASALGTLLENAVRRDLQGGPAHARAGVRINGVWKR